MTYDEHMAAAKQLVESQREMLATTPQENIDIDFYERFVILSELFANHLIAAHTQAAMHESSI